MHNKAVVEFYRDDLKNYNEFRKCLDEIIGEMPNLSVQAFDIKDLSLAIPLFNKAVILFQLRQSQAALKILLVLLKHLDAFDVELAQKIGLLAIQLVLNLNQPKKAEAIITLLKMRLSTSTDLLSGSDEDDEPNLLLDKIVEPSIKTVKSLNEFRWMFRLYKMRSKVMNEKSVLIPNEEVSVKKSSFLRETLFKRVFFSFYSADTRIARSQGTSILCWTRLSNGGQGTCKETNHSDIEFFVSETPIGDWKYFQFEEKKN